MFWRYVKIVILIALISVIAFNFKGIVAHVKRERAITLDKKHKIELNFIKPSFVHLAALVENDTELESGELAGYIKFYEKASGVYPKIAEIDHMLGVCFYLDGNIDRSLKSFEASYQKNPAFFWTNYNLGVTYFRKGEFGLSAQFFNKALLIKKDLVLRVVSSSGIFRYIWKEIKNPEVVIIEHLKQGISDAYVGLGLSLKALGVEKKASESMQIAAQLKGVGDFSFLKDYQLNIKVF